MFKRVDVFIKKRAHDKARKKKIATVKGWLKDLDVKRELSGEQKKEILDYYKKLTGRKVSLVTHEYFYSRTGIYSKEYVPLELFDCDLLPKANKITMSVMYGNKNMGDIVLPKDIQPRAILKRINGWYYFDGEPVSQEEAFARCVDLGDVVVKPSGQSQGRGVKRVVVTGDKINGTDRTFRQMLEEYGKNYIVQEAVRQHKDMSALNPTSVNTLRIVTYRSDNEVLLVYCVVRIGRKGCVIDNQCAGGISTAVNEDGTLRKFAFGGYGENNVTKTDTGIVLEGYKIPSYEKALEFAKSLHLRIPYFRLLGWDVAIAEDGNPVMIELNTLPGLSQSAYGPGFGKYNERIIKEIWKEPNTKFAY